jgi:hypothetical protein
MAGPCRKVGRLNGKWAAPDRDGPLGLNDINNAMRYPPKVAAPTLRGRFLALGGGQKHGVDHMDHAV